MGQAPDAILKLNSALQANPKRPKTYRFSGIVGDRNHSFGYHLSPNDISGWDYSLQTARDKAGAKAHPNLASAWDLSFGPADMKLVTNRLLKAAKARDPRVHAVREFCGTLDGNDTYPWDLLSNTSEGIGSWDASHLWHVHISFYRDVSNNYDALKGVLDVICGVGAAPVIHTPSPTPSLAVVKYPLSITKRMGLSAVYSPNVLALQLRLQVMGYAPKDVNWADGYYGKETVDAVNKFKKFKHWTQNGKVGKPTWDALFS